MLLVMQKYVKENGFTYRRPEGRFAINDIILRKRDNDGKIIQDIPYCKLFDTATDKLLKDGSEDI
jgi:N-acetylmuramoyl-L-alanine amidase CwlA